MARKRTDIDYDGFEPVGDEFTNRRTGSDSGSSGNSSASGGGSSASGGDGDANGSGGRPDQLDVGNDLVGNSGSQAEVSGSGKPASGGSDPVRFSVGSAIFGKRKGNGGVGDGGSGTREDKEPATVRRSRKSARTLMAEESVEESVSPKSKSKKSSASGKKLTQTEAAEVAEGLLDMGGYVVSKIVDDDDANFTDDEKDDILPGLTRIMARMSPAAANRYRNLTDPFMLMLAFYFYAARVMPMYQEKKIREAYERGRIADQYPGDSQSVSDVDHPKSPPNPKNGFGRGRGFSG